MLNNIYIYIYIERERERERQFNFYYFSVNLAVFSEKEKYDNMVFDNKINIVSFF